MPARTPKSTGQRVSNGQSYLSKLVPFALWRELLLDARGDYKFTGKLRCGGILSSKIRGYLKKLSAVVKKSSLKNHRQEI